MPGPAGILTWHQPAEMIRLCRFIAATRPGYDLDQMRRTLPPEYLERIDSLETPGLLLSSTDLRRRVRDGQTIRYLVPDPVAAYVHKHGLYRDEA